MDRDDKPLKSMYECGRGMSGMGISLQTRLRMPNFANMKDFKRSHCEEIGGGKWNMTASVSLKITLF
jgi:hypothetical protein